MRRTLKLVAAVVVGLLLLVGGLIVGYNAGYADSAASSASVQSVLTVNALRAIRENKTDEAIKRLETTLDGDLITSWALRDAWRPRAAISRDNERKLLARVAEYRREFPSQSPNADVRA